MLFVIWSHAIRTVNFTAHNKYMSTAYVHTQYVPVYMYVHMHIYAGTQICYVYVKAIHASLEKIKHFI